MADSADNDERISQFLAFTGSSDASKAVSYLEMSGNNVETAVGLYMEHEQGGGGMVGGASSDETGGGGTSAGFGFGIEDGIRAPDETRRMQLMEEPGGAAGFHPAFQMMNDFMQAQLNQPSAFASPTTNRAPVNPRALLDQAIAQGIDAADYMDDSAMDEDEEKDSEETKEAEPARLSDMFAAPTHIMHTAGGFLGARTMAKDSKRWLLVNIQRDAEFASHALNRDVWRDELVENLVREGFIFWQQMDTHPDGQTYCQRYKVYSYPHIAIIDPRTGRLMWSREGWTLENPVTAETFAEMAMDFCSRNSLERPPQAPRVGNSSAKRPAAALSEADQLQAALRASMNGSRNTEGDDENPDEYQYDDEVEVVEDTKPAPSPVEKKSLNEELRSFNVPEEPKDGARIQVRFPDGKRAVRKFNLSDSVRTVYAFIVQLNEEAGGGREFSLMAGYPPRDLVAEIDASVEDAQLKGEAVTMRWKK